MGFLQQRYERGTGMADLEQQLEQQMEIIRRGTIEIIPGNELADKLRSSIKNGRPLTVKLGLDPTARIFTSAIR